MRCPPAGRELPRTSIANLHPVTTPRHRRPPTRHHRLPPLFPPTCALRASCRCSGSRLIGIWSTDETLPPYLHRGNPLAAAPDTAEGLVAVVDASGRRAGGNTAPGHPCYLAEAPTDPSKLYRVNALFGLLSLPPNTCSEVIDWTAELDKTEDKAKIEPVVTEVINVRVTDITPTEGNRPGNIGLIDATGSVTAKYWAGDTDDYLHADGEPTLYIDLYTLRLRLTYSEYSAKFELILDAVMKQDSFVLCTRDCVSAPKLGRLHSVKLGPDTKLAFDPTASEVVVQENGATKLFPSPVEVDVNVAQKKKPKINVDREDGSLLLIQFATIGDFEINLEYAGRADTVPAENWEGRIGTDAKPPARKRPARTRAERQDTAVLPFSISCQAPLLFLPGAHASCSPCSSRGTGARSWATAGRPRTARSSGSCSRSSR